MQARNATSAFARRGLPGRSSPGARLGAGAPLKTNGSIHIVPHRSSPDEVNVSELVSSSRHCRLSSGIRVHD
jgi:hypothetical protein